MRSEAPAIEAIVVINNAISAHLARHMLERDAIALENVALIFIRDLPVEWADRCGQVLRYGRKPRYSLLGQCQFIGFFSRGARLIRRAKSQGRLRQVYLVNNDNLLTSPLYIWAEEAGSTVPGITVIAEGIMNYQEIGTPNRAAWRWWVKPLLARLLGLAFRQPSGHLSGSEEPATRRVVSFTSQGLKAPADKVVVLPFDVVVPQSPPDWGACLIVHTGLWQWMSTESYQRLAKRFVEWLSIQGFSRILTKAHPHVATGIIEKMLPGHQEITDRRSVEAMAAEIPAGTIIGTCCTALATLKLIRPDLRCVDFGADFYCDHAYHGDQGVVAFLKGAGVEVLPSRLVRHAASDG